MKAFVIKNKEGKYFINRYVQAKKIYNAFIFEDKNDAEQVKGKDDEVVEITISEGDLEQQQEEQHDLLIDEFRKEREELCKQIRKESDARERFVEKVKQLKEQLTEKDKEIERLKQENDKLAFALAEEPDKDELLQLKQDFDILYNKTKERDASIRKQVCDEIREKILTRMELPKEEWVWYSDSYVGVGLIKEILDQIEQAKESI